MDALEEFKQTYFQECDELLGDLESHLMALQDGETEVETLHAAFRAIHSIKGGAGAFGFDRLVSFSHTFETVLDLMREGKVAPSEECVGIVVRAGDIVADLVAAARNGEEPAADFGADVLDQLAAIAGEEGAAEGADAGGEDAADDVDEIEFTPIPVDLDGDGGDGGDAEAQDDADEAAAPPAASERFRITFRPAKTMFTRAHEPLIFVRELRGLGGVTTTADVSDLPDLAELDPEAAYIGWTFELKTAAGRQAVEEVFEFVIDDCDLTIEAIDENGQPVSTDPGEGGEPQPDAPAEPQPDAPAEPQPEEPTPPAAEAAPETPEMPETPETPDTLETSDEPPAVPTAEAEPTPDEVEPTPVEADSAPTAPTAGPKPADKSAKEAAAPAAKASGVTAIRVDLDKIDRLVNMVGELVITQAMISQQSDPLLAERYPQLVQGLEQLHQHTRGLQDSVMAIRAQPVKSVFSRMPRLVRELSAQTGKKVKLVMSGESTEIDKTVIEQLNDPLTHMIRNAADHGVEAPDVREAAGKPAEGTIHLSAEQRGGRIVIQIADDGAGVNREKVRAKAIERNLIAADAKLSDEEIDNLIFLPGFSTADQISNISGRGVGMDVVKQNIQKLGGRVTVRSEPGKGSRMVMTLPLTLAVLDGMIVRVGDDHYVLALANIVESLLPHKDDLQPVAGGGTVLRIRGQYVEIVSLRRSFDMAPPADADQELIVIVEVEGGDQVGLVVDEIVGQQQVVIKSLEENFDPISGIGGATILGDGNVALILDVAGLRAVHKRKVAGQSQTTSRVDRDQEHAA